MSDTLKAPTVTTITLPGSRHTHEQRLEAAVSYVMSGSMAEVARRTGIPESTLSGWRNASWWAQLVEEVRSHKDAEIDAGLSRVIAKAVAAVEDRLDHGDVSIVLGQPTRVPVKAKDAAIIAAVAIDKRQKIRDPNPLGAQVSAEERLELLAQRLLSLNKKPDGRIIEGDVSQQP